MEDWMMIVLYVVAGHQLSIRGWRFAGVGCWLLAANVVFEAETLDLVHSWYRFGATPRGQLVFAIVVMVVVVVMLAGPRRMGAFGASARQRLWSEDQVSQ